MALIAFALMVTLGFLIAKLRYSWDRIAPNAFIADLYRQILRIHFTVGGVVAALDGLGATVLLGTRHGRKLHRVDHAVDPQPYRPNDVIEGDTGKVIRLTSSATTLLSH